MAYSIEQEEEPANMLEEFIDGVKEFGNSVIGNSAVTKTCSGLSIMLFITFFSELWYKNE